MLYHLSFIRIVGLEKMGQNLSQIIIHQVSI